MENTDVREVVTGTDGTEELRPLKPVPAPRPANALSEKQVRALRSLILLKLLTAAGRESDE